MDSSVELAGPWWQTMHPAGPGVEGSSVQHVRVDVGRESAVSLAWHAHKLAVSWMALKQQCYILPK
eukprot:6255306-Amphidinium_carterae.1